MVIVRPHGVQGFTPGRFKGDMRIQGEVRGEIEIPPPLLGPSGAGRGDRRAAGCAANWRAGHGPAPTSACGTTGYPSSGLLRQLEGGACLAPTSVCGAGGHPGGAMGPNGPIKKETPLFQRRFSFYSSKASGYTISKENISPGRVCLCIQRPEVKSGMLTGALPF